MSAVFDLILRGQDDQLRPETFHVRELAKALLRLEDAVASEAGIELPDLEATRTAFDPDPLLALVNITPSSNCLTFNASPAGEQAVSIISRNVAAGTLAGLKIDTQRNLWRLWRPLNDRLISLEVRPREARLPISRFVLTRDQPLPPVDISRILRNGTTIYGRVMRVGGKAKATAQIEAFNKGGRIITVRITKAQAEQLGHLMYKEVALKGIGEWRIDDMKLVAFAVRAIQPVPSEDPIAVFKRLSQLIGDRLEGKDPNAIVRDLRGEDDAE
ncbi:MAG TPA: hypothetical protein VKE40_03150 [Gemmataceae bacterium]|nr:hypothetical protein [Gemmataceae bacterium]